MECPEIRQWSLKSNVESAMGEAGANAIKSYRCVREFYVSYTSGMAVLSDFEGLEAFSFEDYGKGYTNAPVVTFAPVLPELFSSSGIALEDLIFYESFSPESLQITTVFRSKSLKGDLYAMVYQAY